MEVEEKSVEKRDALSIVEFSWWEPIAALASVVLFNVLVYHGHGLTGAATFLFGWAGLMWLGSPRRKWLFSTNIVLSLLLITLLRLVWLGDELVIGCGLLLTASFTLTLWGKTPYLHELFVHVAQMGAGGVMSWIQGIVRLSTKWHGTRFAIRLGLLLPVAAVLVFGTIFVFANPDLAAWVKATWYDWVDNFLGRLEDWLPVPVQLVLWIVVGVCTLGLMRPLPIEMTRTPRRLFDAPAGRDDLVDNNTRQEPIFESAMLGPYRNMLISLIVLFVVYLVFEFTTLWGRDFPQGFYYAGYAHEGAGWLTAALALATVVLSTIFRGDVLTDERLPGLKKLAWGWSALNVLLAIAVYHRLMIYINFNGMTRMRMVGLFGVTTVIVGFLLVITKIVKRRNFFWLIQRQLWVPAVATVLYAATPVDWLVHTWNSRQILAGHLAPAVQITEHDVDAQGVLALCSLADHEDPVIRDGIRSLLARWSSRLGRERNEQETDHWTAFQYAETLLIDRLAELHPKWSPFEEQVPQESAWKAFRKFAYQWY
ncbi:MAG: DUF4153 domain-containing protein [Planctomycetaceae bacterium]